MYRTQVSPHRHGFLVERQYDSNDKGAWITIERYFTRFLDRSRKDSKTWIKEIAWLLTQDSANLPPIEIPIAPPISYNVHERLERAEAEIEARNRQEKLDKEFVEGCMRRVRESDRLAGAIACKSVFEQLEKTVTEVSDRQPK